MTHARICFRRAIERRALWMAEDAARDMPNPSLQDALQLVHLYADQGSPKFDRAALRWLDNLAGVPEKTSTAVTVRITLTDGEDEETSTDTFHAVAVDGEWKWVLTPAGARAFKQGICPT